jgi:hypothetical protein
MIITLNLELGETEQLPLVNCLRGRRVGSNFSCVSESRVFVAAALKVGSGLFSCSALGSCQGAGALISGEATMNEKLSHDEVSARGGKSKSPEKMRAVARNLELAKQALSKKRATAAKELLSAGGESRCAKPMKSEQPAGPVRLSVNTVVDGCWFASGEELPYNNAAAVPPRIAAFPRNRRTRRTAGAARVEP